MKKLVRFTFCLAAVMVLVAASASATIIADWTFESSYVSISGSGTSIGSISPEVGSGTASGVHAGSAAWTTPVGINPQSPDTVSLHSFSANNWAVGDYFQFQVSTLNLSGITVSWDQTGSATGPRDFLFRYSTDGANFTTVTPAVLLLVNSTPFWGTTVVSTKYTSTYDLSSLDGTIGNQSAVYFRLVDNGTTSLGGVASVGTGGTDRVDNFTVSGIPEPSTVMLVGLGLVGCVAAIRRGRRS